MARDLIADGTDRRRHDPEGRVLPRGPARRRQAGARDRRPRATRASCSRCSPTAASAPSSCRAAGPSASAAWHAHEQRRDHRAGTSRTRSASSARQPVAFVRGRGCEVWDADGKRYLDFFAGLAVNNLGHCHPAVVEAIRAQAATLAARLQPLPHRAGGRAGCAPLPALVRRAGLPLQQRRRGERGGDEARAALGRRARRRSLRDPRRRTGSFHGRTFATAHRDRPGEVPRRLPAAAAGHPPRALRRPGGDARRRARRDHRDPRRADPGRGRRRRRRARTTSPACARSATDASCCSSSTRSRPASGRTGRLFALRARGHRRRTS